MDEEYNIKNFNKEIMHLKPDLIEEYTLNYIDIYDMYKEMYPYLSDEEIAEKATSNMLNKIEYTIYDLEYLPQNFISDDPDGYEVIIKYINENLNPDYNATLDTTKENIEILKENIDNMSIETKELALLYIEDMELGDKLKENFTNGKSQIEPLSISSEKEATLKAVSYAKMYWENYNPNYPNWGSDCANFVSQCLFAGEKTMRNQYPKTDDSRNWFSYGSKRDTSKVSSTWRGADMFKWHWMSRAYDYKDFNLSKSGELSKLYNYAQAGYPMSFLNSEGRATHTLIITGFNNKAKDVGVRNHSGRADDKKSGVRWLSGDDNKVRVYKVYDL